MQRKILTIILSLLMLLIFAPPALAQEAGGAQLVFGDNLILEEGQTLNRDVIVFGGNVTVPASSKITGDMVVFGGNANIDGTVAGDIGMIGGNISLGETAVVDGDIGLVGGRPNVAEGAVVKGRIENINRFDYNYDQSEHDLIPGIPPIPPTPPIPSFSDSFDGSGLFHWIGRLISDALWNISLLIILSLITWLVAAFMPEQMLGVRRTVTAAAPMSFGFGLLTAVIVGLSFLLIFTICLLFVPFIALFVAGIATLFGWIVIGQIIGERLLVASGRSQPGFIFSSLIGVVILTVVANMPVVGQVPCLGFLLNLIGFMIGLIVALTGLGAVLLTRFGTRPYPPSSYTAFGGWTPSPGGATYTSPADDLDLDLASSGEAELKAKIKAALAETDAVDTTTPEEPAQPEPAADEPAEEPSEPGPDDEQTDPEGRQ